MLNAENQVYVTRRDLAKATLDTLMAQLRLKSVTGALGDEDIARSTRCSTRPPFDKIQHPLPLPLMRQANRFAAARAH